MSRTIAGALVFALALTSTAFAADTYPRLATYALGSPQDFWDPAYQKRVAGVQVAILGVFPGWGSGRGLTTNDAARMIKTLNPNTKVVYYVRGESLAYPGNPVFASLNAKVDAEKWWLYTSATNGVKVLSDYGNNEYILNVTPTSRKDASGKTFSQWFGGYVVSTYVTPNPSTDGVYTDNVFYAPRRDGDWDLNGTLDSHTNPAVQASFRAGYAQYATAFRAAAPGKYNIVNAADWVVTGVTLTEYVGQFHGGLIEHFIGRPYSVESYLGWQALMTGYRKVMATLAAPKLAVCSQDGSIADYQAMRYGLASCSMDDGYYDFSNDARIDYGTPWFDEFDVKLGAAASGAQTTAWQAGVYRRDFEKGIVLVNPKGNGPRTVTLESDFVKIKGSQDPVVNNGQTVRTVTLKDRDGLFLLRSAAVVRPEAPGNLTVSP